MNIKFSKTALPRTGTIIVFASEGLDLAESAQDLDLATGGQVSRASAIADFTGKRDVILEITAPNNSELERILLVGVGKPDELSAYDAEKLGGKICGKLLQIKVTKAHILADTIQGLALKPEEFAARIASGARLRDYKFDKYKTKNNDKKQDLKEILIGLKEPAKAQKIYNAYDALATGVFLARDLVNEPPNELYPESFAKRAKELTKLGLKVEVVSEKQLRQRGFAALVGVGEGSVRDTLMVVMSWMGGKKGKAPVAFVGKGVTFDTGGISLKPGAGMGDMKGDMGGAACVTGLMCALAGRKAKVNAVGIIGLVENMPDAAAQRPGDIVKSLSGQTIEILNTDAEGRLVLADVLWYTQKRFKPQFMIDLATLTGAILVALGNEHAGLFSNSDELCERLSQAGTTTGEKVWRMPLTKAYDKMIDCKVADMKNIGGRHAGSITAAQFLQRFVNEVPWAHLDIAGTAMNSPKTAINESWGSGYGVRLLNQLVADHYEK